MNLTVSLCQKPLAPDITLFLSKLGLSLKINSETKKWREVGEERKKRKSQGSVFLNHCYSQLCISGYFHSTHMYLTKTNVSQSNNYPYRRRQTFIFSLLFCPILFNSAFDTLVNSMKVCKNAALRGCQS